MKRLSILLIAVALSRSASAQQLPSRVRRRPCRKVEERLSLNERWGVTLFSGAAALYGDAPIPLDRTIYPTIGAGLHFVIKPVQRMLVNLEYAQGIGDSRGVYLQLGYAW